MNCDNCGSEVSSGWLVPSDSIWCSICTVSAHQNTEGFVKVVCGDFNEAGFADGGVVRGSSGSRSGAWKVVDAGKSVRDSHQPDADVMGFLHGRFGVTPDYSRRSYKVWLRSLAMEFYEHAGGWCCDLWWHDEWAKPAPRLFNRRHTGGHDNLKDCASESARLARETLERDLKTLKGEQ